jgi:hypothetical protein
MDSNTYEDDMQTQEKKLMSKFGWEEEYYSVSSCIGVSYKKLAI